MPGIMIIALNINTTDLEFKDFAKLSAKEKIKIIKNHIDTLCKHLKKTASKEQWVFVWREYGITEGSTDQTRAITNAMKKHFKKEMLSLTNKYSNLTIIAGTVSTLKTTTFPKALDILHSYDIHPMDKRY